MSIAATLKQIFGPEIRDNNRLNTAHLAIATRGYHIQTEILHIPERFGIFSSGPPRLQAHQGFLFVIQMVLMAIWGVPAAFGLLLLRYTDRELPMAPFVKYFGLMFLSMIGMLWVGACLNKRRAPDYDWGERKVHQE
ncbi:hypothetical protein CCHR01_03439 [Colletotrichum chrysophilum]|uniref:Uncharacterized protein n=1 Tax=Colletotrichum chrysophilum TaxID=1836956 RepID=A0AAD9ASU5_9PEZI|nr:hypothetical protein CCHR01_03439 [Colletotrichum chrysophilum]